MSDLSRLARTPARLSIRSAACHGSLLPRASRTRRSTHLTSCILQPTLLELPLPRPIHIFGRLSSELHAICSCSLAGHKQPHPGVGWWLMHPTWAGGCTGGRNASLGEPAAYQASLHRFILHYCQHPRQLPASRQYPEPGLGPLLTTLSIAPQADWQFLDDDCNSYASQKAWCAVIKNKLIISMKSASAHFLPITKSMVC